MISDNTIDQVKAAVMIVDVIKDHVKLKKDGSNYRGLCPFHNESSPSFTVNKEKDMYKCFGCGESGDAIAFIRKHKSLGYADAIKELAEKYNIEVEEEKDNDYVKPEARLQKVSDKILKFFENRGISNYTLLKQKVTCATEWMPKFKKEVETICFNFYRGEELVNIKFRGPEKDFKLAKDAELIFYNLNALEKSKSAVIVEGEIDCLSMDEAGIYNSVSVPQGAGSGNARLKYLDNCWSYFEGMDRIVLAVDNDTPGNALKEELSRRLGKERCYVVNYPEDCKDANDVLRKYGKEGVNALVENATLYPMEGIWAMEEFFDEISDWYDNGYPKGAKARIPGFDELLSFAPGQLTMVTGIPNSGKDEFLNYITVGLVRNEGWKFGICSFEESSSVTTTKLQEKYTGKAFEKRSDPSHRMSRREFDESAVFVDQNYFFINVNKVEPTIDAVLAKAVELVMRKGITGLIINPWNYLEFSLPPGVSETNYVSQVLTKILFFAGKYGVHVFLVAHPTKVAKDKKTGKYEVPNLYSISGSANFYNKTTNGISVWRDFEHNITDIYVQKCKFYWLGKIGYCSFRFNTLTRQYEPLISDVPEGFRKLED